MDTARRNLKRVTQLQAESLASEREMDDLTGRTRVLEASLQRIEAELDANSIRLKKSELRAPFNAVVASRLIDSGTIVDPGTPIFRLVESGTREIRAGVPVAIASQLSIDDEILVRNGEQQTNGQLLGLAPEVDQATRSRSLRVRVKENWSPGDLAYLRISVPIAKQGTWLPDTAVTEGVRGTWVVYAVRNPGNEGSQLEARSVVIHHARGNELFVSGALENGDRVVTSGLQRLAPGQMIRALPEQVLADAN
jgi:RND family efflux transporter MFP subunit